MSFKQGKTCPVCLKENIFYLSDHLRQVHKLSSAERKPWLKSAIFSPTRYNGLPPYPFWGMQQQYPTCPQYSMSSQLPMNAPQSRIPKQPKTTKIGTVDCLETQPYPEFMFQHMFSKLVVGPSQCGKTYFVQQLPSKKCIDYPEEKPLQIYWFYNQWQPRYDEIKQTLKKKIRFVQGIPNLSEDLSDINPEVNNILVFDDLMSQASDSPVISKLFTQGRHRNARVILLLQNMFPKGKFNTDTSRNAVYKVLFRSPGDRKQIDIMSEQTFAKDRKNFMAAYVKETEKPFGYIILDNHPRTICKHQVVADVFGECYTYPHITKGASHNLQLPECVPEVNEQPTVKPKVTVKKQTVKRKVEYPKPNAKKPKKHAMKRKPTKKSKKQPKRKTRKPRKQAVYQPEFNQEQQLSSDDDRINIKDFDADGEIQYYIPEEFNELERQTYRVASSKGGFGPRFA